MGKTHFGVIYNNIGNVLKPDLERRKVSKQELVISPDLVLKMYAMLKRSPDDFGVSIQEARRFLEAEITGGRIEPLSGLGFAIFSEDTLNVARWDKENPLVPPNRVYSYDGKNFEQLDIRKVGSFCIYEMVILAHERSVWERFLKSRGETEDKKEYLNSWFEGEIR